jgi:hypothetical protein
MAETESGFVLDGNAAAGLLQEFFAFEVTAAQTKCAACGAIQIVGALRLYAAPMGAVLRCPRCERVVVKAVRTPHGGWLELTGTEYLRF